MPFERSEFKKCRAGSFFDFAVIGLAILVICFLGWIATSCGTNASGSQGKTISNNAAHLFVRRVTQGKAHVESVFQAGDMTGVVLGLGYNGARQTLGWITPPPRHLIIGNVYNAKGARIAPGWAKTLEPKVSVAHSVQHHRSRVHARPPSAPSVSHPPPKAAPAPAQAGHKKAPAAPHGHQPRSVSQAPHHHGTDPHAHTLSSKALLSRLASAAGIEEFSGAHKLYVFFDANCIYCHMLYERIQALSKTFKSDGVSVDFVPVAVLKKSSLGKGAAVLAGGMKALAYDEDHYHASKELGGIKASHNKHAVRAVIANTHLMLDDGHPTATPTLVWKNANTSAVHILADAVTKSQLKHILNVIRGAHHH